MRSANVIMLLRVFGDLRAQRNHHQRHVVTLREHSDAAADDRNAVKMMSQFVAAEARRISGRREDDGKLDHQAVGSDLAGGLARARLVEAIAPLSIRPKIIRPALVCKALVTVNSTSS